MPYTQLIPAPTQSGGRRSESPTAKLNSSGLLLLNKATITLLGEPEKVVVSVDVDTRKIKLQPTTPDDRGGFTLSAGGQASARVYLRSFIASHPQMAGDYTVRTEARSIVLTQSQSAPVVDD